MNKVSANLNMLFTHVPLLERYAAAAAAGFKLVEVSIPYSESAEKLREAADSHKIKHTLINAPPGCWSEGFRGLASLASQMQQFRESIDIAIEYANILDCPRVHVMAGIPLLSDDISKSSSVYLENVKFATERLHDHHLLCLIEPINNYTIPGYFLNNYQQAKQMIDTLNHPNLKIQYDVFHGQQINGQIIETIRRLENDIGYIQVAQVPNRGACDTSGELDYNYIFSKIKEINSDWIIGAEYLDPKCTPTSFDWIHKMSLSF